MSGGYADPSPETLNLGSITFNSSQTRRFKAPQGKDGRIADLEVEVTTTLGAATKIQIGTAADPDKYLDWTLGTDAAPAVYRLSADNAAAMKNDALRLPGDDGPFVVTTSGTTGVGHVRIAVDWF